MSILVTGGCGFIGSNFIRHWLSISDETIINVDCMTYAADPTINETLKDDPRYKFFKTDIGSITDISGILAIWRPRAIINFAAESHVDNSIANSHPFIQTNILGTYNLLECVRQVCPTLKFIHVSTDEVYGSLDRYDPRFNERTPYDPRSPYSASKAASDHLVSAYHHTHGIQTIITNCSNNYGPWQHPEKLIPTIIRNALAGLPVPIYGNGLNIRDWIFVTDHVDALVEILERGEVGESYNLGGDAEYENIQLAKMILDILSKSYGLQNSSIEFVTDRKGHDFRYAIDSYKAHIHIGWKPRTKFRNGLEKTIAWYMNNQGWIEQCLKRSASS
jgi:dTDP-glucose 4,6-dehydratase